MPIEWIRSPGQMGRDIQPEKILGGPFRNFMNKSTILLQSYIRENTPVDRGQARQSIHTKISGAQIPTWGRVASNLARVRHLNYGTGSLSVAPSKVGDWEFPTGEQLNTWAKRHGFSSGAIVAAIIKRRGGLRPRGFFEAGFERAKPIIVIRYLADLVSEIKRAFGQ